MSYPVVGSLAHGAEVDVAETVNGFRRVPSRNAWASAQYLTPVDSTPTTASTRVWNAERNARQRALRISAEGNSGEQQRSSLDVTIAPQPFGVRLHFNRYITRPDALFYVWPDGYRPPEIVLQPSDTGTDNPRAMGGQVFNEFDLTLTPLALGLHRQEIFRHMRAGLQQRIHSGTPSIEWPRWLPETLRSATERWLSSLDEASDVLLFDQANFPAISPRSAVLVYVQRGSATVIEFCALAPTTERYYRERRASQAVAELLAETALQVKQDMITEVILHGRSPSRAREFLALIYDEQLKLTVMAAVEMLTGVAGAGRVGGLHEVPSPPGVSGRARQRFDDLESADTLPGVHVPPVRRPLPSQMAPFPPGGQRVPLSRQQVEAIVASGASGRRGITQPLEDVVYRFEWLRWGGSETKVPPNGFLIRDRDGQIEHIVINRSRGPGGTPGLHRGFE